MSSKGDQHQFSPHKIDMLPKEMVMRVNKNDHLRQNALICCQTPSTNPLRKFMKISTENLYVDSGA